MTTDSFDWDDELPPETEEEVYRALLRALRRKQGFGLFFVQCTPAQGKKIVANLRRDLAQQRIEEMHLEGEVLTLYDRLTALWKDQPFDVLIVEGLQHSLYAYEDTKRFSGWSSSEIYNYSWKGVPQILNHLNQQRERLRDEFPARFVFLVPPFVVDYFIQRAADFLDWRSGLFRFPRDPQDILKEADFLVSERDLDQYYALASQERVSKILALKTTLKALESLENQELSLGHLETASPYEISFIQSSQAVAVSPILNYQLNVTCELGHLFAAEEDYENAIISYDKALTLQSEFHIAWYGRGLALNYLGRYEEAIASYDKAIEIKSDFYEAWYRRGITLRKSGRYQEALKSYEKAIEIQPSSYEAWNNRGSMLGKTGHYHEALRSFEQALEIWEEYSVAWYGRGVALYYLGDYKKSISSIDQALEIEPDDAVAWHFRGLVLETVKQYGEAIESYSQSLQRNSNSPATYYKKACCHSLQAQADLAIASLQKAIALDARYQEMARTDGDFDAIREDERFQALLRE